MKQRVSFERTVKWGKTFLQDKELKNKEKMNGKYLLAGGKNVFYPWNSPSNDCKICLIEIFKKSLKIWYIENNL